MCVCLWVGTYVNMCVCLWVVCMSLGGLFECIPLFVDAHTPTHAHTHTHTHTHTNTHMQTHTNTRTYTHTYTPHASMCCIRDNGEQILSTLVSHNFFHLLYLRVLCPYPSLPSSLPATLPRSLPPFLPLSLTLCLSPCLIPILTRKLTHTHTHANTHTYTGIKKEWARPREEGYANMRAALADEVQSLIPIYHLVSVSLYVICVFLFV